MIILFNIMHTHRGKTYACVRGHNINYMYAYLEESKEELDEFGCQSFIIVANGKLIQATDSIVPT